MQISTQHIAELVKLLDEVHTICEAQAFFWCMQEDRFKRFSLTVSSAQEFIDLGMGDDESVEEIVTWLKQRKGELEKYHTVMLRGVNNSFNFATSLKPTPFPTLTLPSLDISLE